MASVHVGRLLGASGFARTVAIKRLHPQLASDPQFVAMLLDEACLIARIHHPNVIPVLDVVSLHKELLLVMDYVHGESLAVLCAAARKSSAKLPPRFAAAIVAGALNGLHAAHVAVDDRGAPLDIVHRDVSPHNILVGVDGVARIFDFGIAHAAQRVQVTRDGQIKGTLPYMSPEQLRGTAIDRRSDVFAAGAVLWESLTGQRRFVGDNAAAVMSQILEAEGRAPSALVPGLPQELDAITLRALQVAPDDRFATARDMALALEQVFPPPTPRELGEWVESMVGPSLARRSASVHHVESDPDLAAAWNQATDAAADEETATRPWIGTRAPRDDESSSEATIRRPTVMGPGHEASDADVRLDAPAPASRGIRSRILLAGLVVAALIAGVLIAPALRSRIAACNRPLDIPVDSTVAHSAARPPPAHSALPTVETTAVASASSAPTDQRDDPAAQRLPLSGTMGAQGRSHSTAAGPPDAQGTEKGATPDDCASNPFTYATVGGKLIKRPRPECFPQ